MKKSNADYQREHAARQREKGLVKVSVWIRPQCRQILRGFAQSLGSKP